jgi:2-polyprenyl-6-methoxyphenol hydroxylase-like FAD-dependent oxidoreductase
MWGGESWGCGERFGFVPLTSGRIYWYATANASSPGQFGTVDDWRPRLLTRFAGWHSPVESLIESTPASHIHFDAVFHRRPTQRWTKGTAALLGDAVHPMTPDLGQGACQAIEDAVVLAACAARFASADVARTEQFLRFYERIRSKRVTPVVRTARLVSRVGQLSTPFACRMRNLIMMLTPPSARQSSVARIAAARKLDEQLRALDSLSRK